MPPPDRDLAQDDPLEDSEARELSFLGQTKRVFVSGTGPAVIVMAEMPGIYPHVSRFARWVREAGFTNVLNPKTAMLYLALLPQFAVFPGRVLIDSLTLSGVHFGIAFVWLALPSALAERARQLFARPAIARTPDAAAGAAFLGFGIRLALSER